MEAQEYCPNAKLVLVGCKLDMRTDVSTLRELSKQRLIPVTHEQVSVHKLTHTGTRTLREKRDCVRTSVSVYSTAATQTQEQRHVVRRFASKLTVKNTNIAHSVYINMNSN